LGKSREIPDSGRGKQKTTTGGGTEIAVALAERGEREGDSRKKQRRPCVWIEKEKRRTIPAASFGGEIDQRAE